MARRKFVREVKIEAVRLVADGFAALAQAACDPDAAQSVLRRWMREVAAPPSTAFRGSGQMPSGLAEIAALKKEVAWLGAVRDLLRKASAFCARV